MEDIFSKIILCVIIAVPVLCLVWKFIDEKKMQEIIDDHVGPFGGV